MSRSFLDMSLKSPTVYSKMVNNRPRGAGREGYSGYGMSPKCVRSHRANTRRHRDSEPRQAARAGSLNRHRDRPTCCVIGTWGWRDADLEQYHPSCCGLRRGRQASSMSRVSSIPPGHLRRQASRTKNSLHCWQACWDTNYEAIKTFKGFEQVIYRLRKDYLKQFLRVCNLWEIIIKVISVFNS